MRLVLVDNDPGALDLLVTDLRLEGHEVVATAADGEAALALCLELRPEALVVDYRMPPGIDGLETARQVLAHLPNTRVVVYSNYVQGETLKRARTLGVRYLQKGDLRALRRALSTGGR